MGGGGGGGGGGEGLLLEKRCGKVMPLPRSGAAGSGAAGIAYVDAPGAGTYDGALPAIRMPGDC